jgi:hypothetical protein
MEIEMESQLAFKIIALLILYLFLIAFLLKIQILYLFGFILSFLERLFEILGGNCNSEFISKNNMWILQILDSMDSCIFKFVDSWLEYSR